MVTPPSTSRRRRLRAAGLAIVADKLLGEPPITPHPISLFGSWMKRAERTLYRDARAAGAAHLVAGVVTGALAGAAMRSTALAGTLAIAGNALDHAAGEVEAALAVGDLDAARAVLPALVGRDPSELDEAGIARAAIESVAENTVDAVIAPAMWAAIGGAPAVLAYRAINTLDAMVGHHNDRYERYGWASARTDDVANYVPARLAAAAVAIARPHHAGRIVAAIRRDAPKHPSPNGGVIETAFAVALGLQLGGTNRYGERIEHRPTLGDGRAPRAADIAAARRLAAEVDLIFAALLIAASLIGRGATKRRHR